MKICGNINYRSFFINFCTLPIVNSCEPGVVLYKVWDVLLRLRKRAFFLGEYVVKGYENTVHWKVKDLKRI